MGRSTRAIARHPRRYCRGQALVEFALVVPVLLGLLVGALDLGRLFYAQITVSGAAREGALQAAQTPDSFEYNTPCDPVRNLVMCRVMREASGGWVSIDQSKVFVGCPTAPPSTPAPLTGSSPGCPTSPSIGNEVQVRVEGTFRMITGPVLDLSSTATAQIAVAPVAASSAAPSPTPTASPTQSPTSTPMPTSTPVPTCPAPTVSQITYSPSDVHAQNNGGQQGTLVTFSSNAIVPPQDPGCAPVVWSWQFGTAGTSSVQNPTFTFPYSTANTTQTVKLTVSNFSGTGTPQSASASVTIQVGK